MEENIAIPEEQEINSETSPQEVVDEVEDVATEGEIPEQSADVVEQEQVASLAEDQGEDQETSELRGLKRKMRFTGTVLRTSLAGALVDIGMDVPGVVHISQLQEEPVNRVEDVVKPGQEVTVWVRRVIPNKERIELTMIEPLALDWRDIEKDMVIKGKVTRLEKFGVFVDIGAERPGLVHISEITHGYIKSPDEVVREGEEVEVKVLSVNRRRKQIKLSMKALEEIPMAKPKKDQPKPAEVVEEPEEEPVPTAMEIAMREAMERSKESTGATASDTRKVKTKSKEHEDLLSRTLDQRPPSSR